MRHSFRTLAMTPTIRRLGIALLLLFGLFYIAPLSAQRMCAGQPSPTLSDTGRVRFVPVSNPATVSTTDVCLRRDTIPSAPPAPVPAPIPVPAPSPVPSGAVMVLDWSRYESTAAFLADTITFDRSNDKSVSEMLIDTVRTPSGGKSLRYRYRHSGSGCNTITVSRDFRLPTKLTEAWAEFEVRWSTNFTTGGQNPAHACDPNDHKLIFGLPDEGLAGRWAFYVGADSDPIHSLNQELPFPNWGGGRLNGAEIPSAETLWRSGVWHTIRLHIKPSSTASSTDGVWEVWIDGSLKHRQTGFATRDSQNGSGVKLRGFSLGRNKDDGPPDVDQYLWWGAVRVYATNPGW